jgi:outer membrane receptor protein involved in Fe transport
LTVQFGRNYGYSTNNTLLPDAVSTKLIQAGGYDQSFACPYVKGPRSCYFNAADFVNGNLAHIEEGVSPAVVADIYQWKGDFTKTHGKHTFQMGIDFNKNGFQQTFNSGHLDFSNSETANGTTGGFSLASFLLAVPDGVTLRNEFETEYGGWVDGFYFQDQWRLTDRLTLNFGARYDVTFLPIYGSLKDGNAPTGNFDANTGNYVLSFTPPTCSGTNTAPPCVPGPLPAHVTVSPNGHFFTNNYDNIQPRVGIAYRLTNETVLRVAYGRFFDNWAAVLQMSQNQQGGWPILGQVSLGANSLNQNAPPTALAENPFQTTSTAPLPTPFGTVYDSNWYVDPNLKNPYSDQWNFGVQQALTENTTVTANYVGSNGHRLDVGITANRRRLWVPVQFPAQAATPRRALQRWLLHPDASHSLINCPRITT